MALVRRRGTIQSETFARKRRKKLIFAGILFLVAIASVCTTVYFFFNTQFVQIKLVEVSGPVGINGGVLSLVPADAVQADIEKDLAGNWLLHLVSKNTLFFYPKNKIRAELMKKYPAIAAIDFGSSGGFLGFGNNIVLRLLITERSPFALACAKDSISNFLQSCFYIDSSGFVYAPAAQFSPGVYVDYEISPQSASSSSAATPGKFIADETSFNAAKQIVGFVSGMGLDVSADSIGSDALGPTNTVIINVASSTASAASTTLLTEIYFNQNEPLDTELRYFSEFWRNQQATTTPPKFQYVDMRYGKDIVYKVYK